MENSLDANQISPIDAGAELISVATSIALTVSTFVSDLEAQYRMTTPWLALEEGELTGVSSIMPQKRNPVALNDVRIRGERSLGRRDNLFVQGAQRSARRARLQRQ